MQTNRTYTNKQTRGAFASDIELLERGCLAHKNIKKAMPMPLADWKTTAQKLTVDSPE